MPYQKSTEQYRRDIYGLKAKLKDQQKFLEELKQKFSDIDILGDDKSYSFAMKLKILQYNLFEIKQKMQKYQNDEAYQYYQLNFCTLALIKATQIFSINRQMIFRAMDIKCQGKVNWHQFSNFLKQTLHLHSQFVLPIMKVLDSSQQNQITIIRYNKYLQSFLINSQQQDREITTIDQASENICKQLIGQKVNIDAIWSIKELNIAILINGIMKKIKNLDVLDCVALYCKIDPLKKGYVQTRQLLNYLDNKINHIKNFQKTQIKLKR